MSPKQIKRIVDEQPFRPLKFSFSNGATEVLKHPENLIIGASWLIFAKIPEGQEFPEYTDNYSILHLVNIAPAEAPYPSRN